MYFYTQMQYAINVIIVLFTGSLNDMFINVCNLKSVINNEKDKTNRIRMLLLITLFISLCPRTHWPDDSSWLCLSQAHRVVLLTTWRALD